MKDTCFIDLIKEENLKRINIDPRLIDTFKRVMERMQKYFNDNGYNSVCDYKKFFEETILTSDESKKMTFLISNEPLQNGALGFYKKNENVIHIDESILSSQVDLMHVFCHEFIHFLSMHKSEEFVLPLYKMKIESGFSNEAMTEIFARKIVSECICSNYEAQVRMHTFANVLSNNVDNFFGFLSGYVSASNGSIDWVRYNDLVQEFQRNSRKTKYSLSDARKNKSYIEAQRVLIKNYIKKERISTLEDYENAIKMLSKRPVDDISFIENFVDELQDSLLDKIGYKNSSYREKVKQYLIRYTEFLFNEEKYIEYNDKGHKIQIDSDRNIYIDEIDTRCKYEDNKLKTFTVNNQIINIGGRFDFNLYVQDKNNKRKNNEMYTKLFTKNSSKELELILSCINDNDLIKIDKFELPNLNDKNKHQPIYVAVYKDKIEILSDVIALGNADMLKIGEYKGISLEGAISSKALFNMKKGYSYSLLDKDKLKKGCVSIIINELRNTIDDTQKKLIIEEYKKSDEYDENDKGNKLFEHALMYYAQKKYMMLDENELKKIEKMVLDNNLKFIITMQNDEVVIVSKMNDQNAIKYNNETLYNIDETGKYNFAKSIIRKNSKFTNDSIKINEVLYITSDGLRNNRSHEKEIFAKKIGLYDITRLKCIYKEKIINKMLENEHLFSEEERRKFYRNCDSELSFLTNILNSDTSFNLRYKWENIQSRLRFLYDYEKMSIKEKELFDEIIFENKCNILKKTQETDDNLNEIPKTL